MTTSVTEEDEMAPQPQGIVEQLVRDDVGRKKFLKAVGGAGAAGFGAFVLAACGSSSTTTSSARRTRSIGSMASRTWASGRASTWRKLRAARPIRLSQPESRRIRREHLIGQRDSLGRASKLKLGVGDDNTPLAGVSGGLFVNPQGDFAQVAGGLCA